MRPPQRGQGLGKAKTDTHYMAAFAPVAEDPVTRRQIAAIGERRHQHKRFWRRVEWLGTASMFFAGGLIFLVVYFRQSNDQTFEQSVREDTRILSIFWLYIILVLLLNFWVERRKRFGARYAHAAILWLRRFHRADGDHRFFRGALGQASPASFAVTLRDSRVMGARHEGAQRAMPLAILILLSSAAVVFSWEPLLDLCLTTEHKCRAANILDPSIDIDTNYDDAVLPASLFAVLSLSALLFNLVVALVVIALGARIGHTRADDVTHAATWFDTLQRKGSANTLYVLRATDASWQDVVAHFYRRSALIVFDITHPSAHIDYELTLLVQNPQAPVMFIRRASGGDPAAERATFEALLDERVPPALRQRLNIQLLPREALAKEIECQTVGGIALAQSQAQP